MIKQRQVYQSIIVEYIDTPVISVAIDGTSVISSLTLPEQTVRQTRIILPETAIGFILQFFFYKHFRHPSSVCRNTGRSV